MKTGLFFVSAVLLCVFVAGLKSSGYAAERSVQPLAQVVYICPMHPQVTSDRKGSCPICGMDLVLKEEQSQELSSPSVEKIEAKILFYRNPMNPSVTSPVPAKDEMGMDYVPVYEEKKGVPLGVLINTGKQQLIGVKKDFVTRRALAIEIATVGKVAYDPELYVAQEEYVQAVKTAAETGKSALVYIREQSVGVLDSAERKLRLLGMSNLEIEALKSNGAVQHSLYLPGKSAKAWVYITVYESEFGLVKAGQEVVVDAVAYPGEIYKGKVTALTPILNAESRTVRVRAEVDDKDGKLKPEMFVNAKILVTLGEQLAIPEEAVLDTGTRKIVYVVKDNRFAARAVTLGPKAGEFYAVLTGLEEGEEIVTSGNFLIDAESKLKGAL